MAKSRRSRKASRKRNRSRSRSRKRTVVKVFAANPKKRRRASKSSRRRTYRRSYRRNPGLFNGMIPSTGFLTDAAIATGGFIGTKMLAGTVLPMVGVSQPIARIAVKAVLAGALGWAGRQFVSRNAGQFLLIGGMVEVVNDAVQTYVAPMVPALAVSSYPELGYYGNEMSAYPSMGAYPELAGMVHEGMSEQV